MRLTSSETLTLTRTRRSPSQGLLHLSASAREDLATTAQIRNLQQDSGSPALHQHLPLALTQHQTNRVACETSISFLAFDLISTSLWLRANHTFPTSPTSPLRLRRHPLRRKHPMLRLCSRSTRIVRIPPKASCSYRRSRHTSSTNHRLLSRR